VRHPLPVLAAALALLVAGCLPASTPGGGGPADPGEVVEVVEVADGDSLTVVIDGTETRVRLMGINAPERNECLGDVSRESLADLVDAADLRLEVLDQDQYGRSIGYLWTADGSVNLAQVATGMAIAFSDGGRLTPDLMDAEEEARRSALGWWDTTECGGGVDGVVTVKLAVPDPPGPDNENLDGELVVIEADRAVDLGGYVLRDESTVNRLVLPAGTTVTPASPLFITSGCEELGWCRGESIWNNSGDAAILVSPGGALIAIDRFQGS